jgi:CheY-like chemotaxis protein
MNKILVVEDEEITSDLLRRYFQMVGYEVVSALNGSAAIQMAAEQQPEVVILDIMLPDMDGYEICRQLRSDERTRRIPIIFLTQKDERRDRLDGLGMGADDYVTKPFDVEELRLRVHNIIARMGGTPLVDPRTSLPNMALIKERLPRILSDPDSIFLDVHIEHYGPFADKYGPVAGNQVVRSAAKIIGDLLHQLDPTGSFVGHPRDDHFLIGLKSAAAGRVEQELMDKFRNYAKQYYSAEEVEHASMKVGNREVPLMSFKVVRVPVEALKTLVSLPDDVKIAAGSTPPPPAHTAEEQAEAPRLPPQEEKPAEVKPEAKQTLPATLTPPAEEKQPAKAKPSGEQKAPSKLKLKGSPAPPPPADKKHPTNKEPS